MPTETRTARRTPLPAAERKAFPIREACEYVGLGRSTLYEMLQAEKLRSVKIGGRRLILREDLDALLDVEAA